jgi:hypothetical protein
MRIKLSKSDWENIGQKMGWIKEAFSHGDHADDVRREENAVAKGEINTDSTKNISEVDRLLIAVEQAIASGFKMEAKNIMRKARAAIAAGLSTPEDVLFYNKAAEFLGVPTIDEDGEDEMADPRRRGEITENRSEL